MKLKIALIGILSFVTFSNISFAQTTFTSIITGNWNDGTTWDQGSVPGNSDDVIVTDGFRVKVWKNNTRCRNLTVNAGGVLFVDDPNGNMIISGNIIVNGIVTQGSKKDFVLSGGTGIYIDGNGYLDEIDFIINDDIAVQSTADLTFVGDIILSADVTVTNNGMVSCDNLIGDNATTSIWTNVTGSTLSVGSDLFNTDGVLNASATDNTVRYFDNTATVKNPSSSQYYNLTIEGSIKTLASSIIVLGDVYIAGEFDVSTFDLTVAGDWTDQSIFNENTRTVTFNGSGNQTISSLVGETFYNLTVNKSGGTLNLSGNVTVSNTLTMTAGNINTGSDKITVGTSTAVPGTLSRSGGTIIGIYEKWLPTTEATNDIIFPVGTSSNYRPIVANFATITTGGTVISQFIDSDPGNNGLFLTDDITLYNTFNEGYWDLAAANSFDPGNYNLSLDGAGFSSFTIDNSSTRIVTRPDDISDWTVDGTHNAVAGTVVSRDAITTFSAQFAFADNTNCTAPFTSALTGSTTVCTTSANVNYSVTDNAGSEYFWSVVGGTMISTSSTNTMTVNWDSPGMVGSITVYEVNSCTQSFPVATSINIHSIAPSSITGKQNIAENSVDITYSVTDQTDYTFTWTITGGTQDLGGTTNSITVDWDGVGAGNVSVVAKYNVCPAASAFDLPVVIYDVINSTGVTDRWDLTTTWDCDCVPTTGENVRVKAGHTVNTSNSTNLEIVHFIVEPGGTFTYNPNAASSVFEITGDLTVNGDIDASYSNGTIELITTNKQIDGIGTITATNPVIIKNNTTILSTSNLSIAGDLNLQSPTGCSVTNEGTVEIEGSLVELTNLTNWVNAAGSTLKIGNSLTMAGSLIADATGNMINYNGIVNQDIKDPATSYYNLTLSGSGTKTALADLNINGDLTIDGTSQLDVTATSYNITIAGNWTNTSTNC